MVNYCMHCGTILHADFGLCPHCDRQRLNQLIYARRAQTGYAPPRPVYADPTTAVQPVVVRQMPGVVEKPTVRQRRKSWLKRLVAMVMTVMLLGVCLGAMGIFAVRQATTEEALTAMVEDGELSDLLALLGEDARTGFYVSVESFVKENTGLNLSHETVDKLLEASELKCYLTEKMAQYSADLYNGTSNFSLDEKEVYRLLRANRGEMEKVIKVNLPDAVLEQTAQMLTKQELFQQISTETLKENAPTVYYALHFGLSYSAVAVLLAVAALLFFAMLRLDFSLGILGGGVALAVTGGLLALPALLIKLSPVLLNTLVGNSFLQSAIIGFLNTNLIISLLVFSVGLALILVRASILMICRLCQ